MGLRQPLTPDQLNALADKQYSQKQLAQPEVEIQEDPFADPAAEAEIARNEAALNAKLAVASAAKQSNLNPPTSPTLDAKTSKVDFYDKLLKEYDDQKKQIASGRNNAAWMEAVSGIASNLGRAYGTDVGAPIEATRAYDEQSKNALEELKTKAALMEKNTPGKAKYEVLGNQIVEISPEGNVKPVFESKYKSSYLDLAKEQKELGEKRLDYTKEKGDRLSDKQAESIVEHQHSLDVLNRIEELFPKVQDKVGIYSSNIEDSKKFVPFLERDADFVQMKQLIGTELASYVHSISGAQSSEPEAQRLRQNIPTMEDKPEEFMTKLKTARELIQTLEDKKLGIYEKQGKNVDSFKGKSEQSLKQPQEDLVKQYATMHKLDEQKAREILIKRMNK